MPRAAFTACSDARIDDTPSASASCAERFDLLVVDRHRGKQRARVIDRLVVERHVECVTQRNSIEFDVVRQLLEQHRRRTLVFPAAFVECDHYETRG